MTQHMTILHILHGSGKQTNQRWQDRPWLVSLLLVLLIPSLATAGSASPPPFQAQPGRVLYVIRDDSGFSAPPNIRGHVTSPRGVVRKELHIPFDPGQIATADIVYRMCIPPFHTQTRAHLSAPSPGIHWADMQLLVNGKVAAQRPAIEMATRGWHRVAIDPSLLREGVNRIDLTWAPLPADNPHGIRYGQFFVAIDHSRHYGRSLSSHDHGKTFTSKTLSPGHARPTEGEYMVRLRLGIPLE